MRDGAERAIRVNSSKPWKRLAARKACRSNKNTYQGSSIEIAYSVTKGKFGDSLRSKSGVGQVNEALCKVLCHNLCVLVQAMHELKIETIFDGQPRFNNRENPYMFRDAMLKLIVAETLPYVKLIEE